MIGVFCLEFSSCLRQAVQELCSQKGIMRGWLKVVKLHPHRQQLSSYSFGWCISIYYTGPPFQTPPLSSPLTPSHSSTPSRPFTCTIGGNL